MTLSQDQVLKTSVISSKMEEIDLRHRYLKKKLEPHFSNNGFYRLQSREAIEVKSAIDKKVDDDYKEVKK